MVLGLGAAVAGVCYWNTSSKNSGEVLVSVDGKATRRTYKGSPFNALSQNERRQWASLEPFEDIPKRSVSQKYPSTLTPTLLCDLGDQRKLVKNDGNLSKSGRPVAQLIDGSEAWAALESGEPIFLVDVLKQKSEQHRMAIVATNSVEEYGKGESRSSQELSIAYTLTPVESLQGLEGKQQIGQGLPSGIHGVYLDGNRYSQTVASGRMATESRVSNGPGSSAYFQETNWHTLENLKVKSRESLHEPDVVGHQRTQQIDLKGPGRLFGGIIGLAVTHQFLSPGPVLAAGVVGVIAGHILGELANRA